jgi:hypothetical protein
VYGAEISAVLGIKKLAQGALIGDTIPFGGNPHGILQTYYLR